MIERDIHLKYHEDERQNQNFSHFFKGMEQFELFNVNWLVDKEAMQYLYSYCVYFTL